MKREENFEHERSIIKGMAAGIAGGIVASFVMDKFQAAWSAVAERMEEADGQKKQQRQEQEPSTVKAAEAVSENLFDHRLSKEEKEYAGLAVHYAVGAGSAAVYGAASEVFPKVTAGAGIPFGTAVWLVMDEIAVPALGFSKPPLEYPASTHAYALASHFVYGLTTEAVRRTVRHALH